GGPGSDASGASSDVRSDGGPGSDASGASSDVRSDGGAVADAESVVESAVEAERERVEYLLEKDEGIQQAELREKLQTTMTENVNVFRTEAGLKQALRDIREVREQYQDVYVADPSRTFNSDLVQTIEMRNLIDVAETIALGALVRTEFRGAHWRAEHQERKDDEWLKHTMITWEDGDPTIWYRSVVLEGDRGTYEPKERSY
ncbi:MAG: succinate dehydrogenase, partial [Halobacteriales archaeon]